MWFHPPCKRVHLFISEILDGLIDEWIISTFRKVGGQCASKPGMRKRCIPACKLPVLQMFLGINSADTAKEITHVGADRCNEGLIGNIGLDGIHDLHSFRINQNPPYGGLAYPFHLVLNSN